MGRGREKKKELKSFIACEESYGVNVHYKTSEGAIMKCIVERNVQFRANKTISQYNMQYL